MDINTFRLEVKELVIFLLYCGLPPDYSYILVRIIVAKQEIV